MLVGEAPGATEDVAGIPFMGAAGQVLNGILADVGLDRSSLYITNIVKCRPPQNRTPDKQEVEACKLYLVRELEAVHPKVIVCLGGAAASALTGKGAVAKSRAQVLSLLPQYRYSAKVLVTYHPAAGLYRDEAKLRAAISEDLRLAQKLAIGSDDDTLVVTSEDDNERQEVALQTLSRCQYLACDCEWEVLEGDAGWPWSRRKGELPRLTSVAIAGYGLDGQPLGYSCFSKHERFPEVLDLVAKLPTLYHNATADLIWLLPQLRATPRVVGDTMILAFLLDVGYSLKLTTLTSVFTGMVGWKVEIEGSLGKRIEVLEAEGLVEDLLVVNAKDGIGTLLLHSALYERLKERPPQLKQLYKELLKAELILADAALRGLPIDEVGLNEFRNATSTAIKASRQRVSDLLSVPGFAAKAPNSLMQVALALEERLNIKLPRTPKTRKPSLKLDNLRALDKDEAAQELMKLAKLNKLQSTYLTPWSYLLTEQGDSRLHTVYRFANARTGRTSAEVEQGGTLQQFPRTSTMRRLGCAPEGWSIVSADQSQIELRVAAWAANETRMKSFFKRGIDIHKATAAYIQAARRGTSVEEFLRSIEGRIKAVSPGQRQAGKPVNFGFLYGMREKKFVATAKKDYGVTFSLEEASSVRQGFFTLYPNLMPWHDKAWEAVKKGYVETPFGRVRKLVREEGEDEEGLHRKAINTPVQSFASDLSLMGMNGIPIPLLNAGLSELAFVVGFVHDAVLLQVKDEVLGEALPIIKQAMENPPFERFGIDFDVPLEVDFKVGRRWS